MDLKVTHKMIKDMCGTVAFKRGDSFNRSKKVILNHYSEDYCEATVNGTEDFHVTIEKDSMGKLKTTCSCPKLMNFQKSCQHVAAVLLAIQDLQQLGISPNNLHDKNREITEDFMKIFEHKSKRTSGHQLHFENREILDVAFTLKPIARQTNQHLFGIKLNINNLKVKNIRAFLQDVKLGKTSDLSADFQYDSTIHCFENNTDEVIQLLIALVEDEKSQLNPLESISEEILLIPPSNWDRLLKRLEVVSTTLENNREPFKLLNGPLPLHFTVEEVAEKENDYQLTITGIEQMIVMESYGCIIWGENIYKLDEKDFARVCELKNMLPHRDANYISIPNNQVDIFFNKIVPGLKKIGMVELNRKITQKMMKQPLIAKLYLDRIHNRLLAGVEFQYENVIIQPLESRDIPIGPMIIRDLDKEEEILQLMDESGFTKTEGGYYMQNEELEYKFLYHVVPKLHQLVQIYATTAVRNRIVTNHFPTIRIKHKKDRMNWLEFKFEMKGIADDQIREILAALEVKKKYFRLQNGTLLSLETKEMEELQNFLDEVPKQDDGYETSLDMPISQGLQFLDRMDSEIFTVEESFRHFLNQLIDPSSLDIVVPKSLNPILRDYQKTGYKWLKILATYGFGGVLADDMGLGKTIQSITYIVSELSAIRSQKLPVLIVCPSSLTYNWLHELMKFAPEVEAVVIDGNKLERENLQKDTEEMDVLITSYPLLRQDIKWYEDQQFHTVFFDEAQAFKNPVTQTARTVQRLQANNRFGLTGTPIENSLEELWSIYHVVFPQLFQGLRDFSYLPKKAVARRVRPFLLRRIKEDVLEELPKKVESLESSELLPEQKQLYAAYLAKLRHKTLKHLDQDTIRKNRIKILAGLTRLRQICCHPALFVEGYKGSSAKYEQLLKIIEESKHSGRRVLIFSQFTKMLELIGKELTMRGYTYFYLDGQTSAQKRVEICDRFNDGERDLFLISLKAGGTGLNLSSADTVILYDLWWNPAVEEQASDRAHRFGQKNEVQVIKLIARGTIEEKMNELQEKKKELIDDIVNSTENSPTGLTEDDIRDILQI